MKKNDVILFGSDHHNILGLVRELGIHGVTPYGLIVEENSSKMFSTKSKYWKKIWKVASVEEGIKMLCTIFSDTDISPVIIPSSDEAAIALDEYAGDLRKKFVIPGFEVKGKLLDLMNKKSQIEYASKWGGGMLPAEEIDLNDCFKASLQYPIIMKPTLSVEGKKADIKIAYTQQEELEYVQALKDEGYKRILRQAYLQNRVEYVVVGAVMPRAYENNFSILKNIRQWPEKFGTGSFSSFDVDSRIISYAKLIMKKVQQSGFCGLIDIEIFESNDGKLYINEFNWRSSGRNFVGRYTQVYSTYWWYCAVSGLPFDDSKKSNIQHGYSMNEITDFRHVLTGKVALFQWLNDIKVTNSFAIWDSYDKAPFFCRTISLAKKALRLW